MNVNEASRTQRLVWIPDDFVSDVVFKGDFVGHPFRGNQWADSSGASTMGASGDQDPSVSANGLQIVSDRTTRTIAETINDKTSNLASDGDARVETFIGSEDSFDKETSKLLQRELDDLSKSVFGVHPQTGMVQRDIGFDMVEGAFWEAHDDDTDLIILRDKSDRIAGAVSFEHEGSTFNELPYGDFLEMGHLGTTGLVDGAGSTLFGKVIKHAATVDSGIWLSPLNNKAAEYWSFMGFESRVHGDTGERVLVMSPESVAKINKELDS